VPEASAKAVALRAAARRPESKGQKANQFSAGKWGGLVRTVTAGRIGVLWACAEADVPGLYATAACSTASKVAALCSAW
jgi:hypothetical protein